MLFRFMSKFPLNLEERKMHAMFFEEEKTPLFLIFIKQFIWCVIYCYIYDINSAVKKIYVIFRR